MEVLTDEKTLQLGLGETWTYLDPSGFPQTISWDEKIRRLGDRKDHAIIKRLKPDLAMELADKVKNNATDKELMECIGAGMYSVGLCVKYLKEIGLVPHHLKNRWSKKRRHRRKTEKRLITCAKLGG